MLLCGSIGLCSPSIAIRCFLWPSALVLVPVTAADVIAPGDNYTAKIDAIMRRSVAAVVDVTTQNTNPGTGDAHGDEQPLQTLVVIEEGAVPPSDLANQVVARRAKGPIADQPALLRSFEEWFRRVAADIQPRLAEEPLRLLGVREYCAAVISAITHLESLLRAALEKRRSYRVALTLLAR